MLLVNKAWLVFYHKLDLTEYSLFDEYFFNSNYFPFIGVKKRPSSFTGEPGSDPDHPPIAVDHFAKHVSKLHKSDDRGFMIEYNVSRVRQNKTELCWHLIKTSVTHTKKTVLESFSYIKLSLVFADFECKYTIIHVRKQTRYY